jgi:hypothetical protein
MGNFGNAKGFGDDIRGFGIGVGVAPSRLFAKVVAPCLGRLRE